MHAPLLRLASRTPLADHAGVVLCWVDRTRAAQLLTDPHIDVIGNRTRIKSLRFRGPDPAGLTTGSHHKRPVGTPHRNENYYNPRGVWHLDRIPESWRQHFCALPHIIKNEQSGYGEQ